MKRGNTRTLIDTQYTLSDLMKQVEAQLGTVKGEC
ncbi:hypothetical protein Spith_2207 [Spirochaeta thermophila DSM 6578]|uniref:Uncharacterized protein n=1 Tax=Winmispira thermophila (strain ATCC 700085 / DSM 6578 / Z-1203) TaxID=869211 RepID=E6JXH9_WINT7|nr:hypothetical protein Spith_0437 [Spirochaeta thermophila DSM 6578]AEJ62462.1 hypothetical protein Spith_2207 [Spirochaeta thermophila DSM 6578]